MGEKITTAKKYHWKTWVKPNFSILTNTRDFSYGQVKPSFKIVLGLVSKWSLKGLVDIWAIKIKKLRFGKCISQIIVFEFHKRIT